LRKRAYAGTYTDVSGRGRPFLRLSGRQDRG
jgi:hypothetical protein